MNYTGNDIYCDVIIPGKVELNIIEETPEVLVYHHTNPHWDTHIIVIPKVHVADLVALASWPDDPTLARKFFDVVARVADKVRKEEGGCTVFTTLGDNQNSKHLHVHVRNGAERTA
jgi:histidine triad (HIT) family protein